MGNLSGESREQNRIDKVTRFRSVTYARQLRLLVNTLGSHFNIKFASATLNCFKHSFFIHTIDMWNNLPKEIAEAENLNTFKN